MTRHIFTYGSLMFAPVWRHVVRSTYRFEAAAIEGHARYAVRGELYPGLIAEAHASTAGVVYFDVRAEDVLALDLFEGDEYRRETVKVRLADGRLVDADTYIYCKEGGLSLHPWVPEAFDMQGFMQTYRVSGTG
jgi:gamma-glutamylcyclotransferase (GGCT)/AIG2-like uncharacterized protein YtfP